jgi:hypothetical protein
LDSCSMMLVMISISLPRDSFGLKLKVLNGYLRRGRLTRFDIIK